MMKIFEEIELCANDETLCSVACCSDWIEFNCRCEWQERRDFYCIVSKGATVASFLFFANVDEKSVECRVDAHGLDSWLAMH